MLLASRNSFIMMRFFQQQETMPPHLPWLINFRNFSWWGSMMSWVHPRLRGWWGNIWLVWPQHSQSPTTLAQVPAPGSDRTQWWRGPYEAALSKLLKSLTFLFLMTMMRKVRLRTRASNERADHDIHHQVSPGTTFISCWDQTGSLSPGIMLNVAQL